MSVLDSRDVLVVGAGVSGLTTAVVLAEAGMTVRVISSLRPGDTTSARAGASWGPFLSGHEAMERWSADSRAEFVALSNDDFSGVRLLPGTEAYRGWNRVPGWATAVPDYRPCDDDEIPGGYDGAWRYTIPLIDMPRYLRYLTARLARHGVEVEIVPPVRDLDALNAAGRVVVNCTGLGSRRLLGDEELRPCRGQLTVVENNGITEFFQDNVSDSDMTCVFPHRDVVVLGGVSQLDTDSLAIDYDEARAMMRRCRSVAPRLSEARVLGHRVGLRPHRERVRLEIDERRPWLVHNYGHGGSGVTASWGCARDVLRRLDPTQP